MPGGQADPFWGHFFDELLVLPTEGVTQVIEDGCLPDGAPSTGLTHRLCDDDGQIVFVVRRQTSFGEPLRHAACSCQPCVHRIVPAVESELPVKEPVDNQLRRLHGVGCTPSMLVQQQCAKALTLNLEDSSFLLIPHQLRR